jgi:hypothetical protein
MLQYGAGGGEGYGGAGPGGDVGDEATADWEQVKTLAREAIPMEKLIKGYSYADEYSAVATDEKVCDYVVKGIRQAKGTIFSIISILYQLEKKEPVSKEMQKLKDELDIFSDEVKARYCEWKGLNEKWTVVLVKHDHSIVTGLDVLNLNLERLYQSMLKDKALLSGDELAEKKLWKRMKKEIPGFEERVDSLVGLFKEREGICNLRPLALEKTFRSIQKRIEKQI